MTAISLVTASGTGFVILAFAVKNGDRYKSSTSSIDKSSSSTSKKGTLSGKWSQAQVLKASLSNVFQQYPEVFQELM